MCCVRVTDVLLWSKTNNHSEDAMNKRVKAIETEMVELEKKIGELYDNVVDDDTREQIGLLEAQMDDLQGEMIELTGEEA